MYFTLLLDVFDSAGELSDVGLNSVPDIFFHEFQVLFVR